MNLCNYCQKELVSTKQRWCNETCRMAFRNRKAKEARHEFKKNRERTDCKLCGSPKPAGCHPNTKFCSPKCRTKANGVKANFRLEIKDYNQLVKKSEGKCNICQETEETAGTLQIDHDHQTGKVRGILCKNCNLGLGHFRDSMILLLQAGQYLMVNTGVKEEKAWQVYTFMLLCVHGAEDQRH